MKRSCFCLMRSCGIFGGLMCTYLFTAVTSLSAETIPQVRIEKLVLVNARTNQAIRELYPMDQINLDELKGDPINIQAVTSPATVGKVIFSVNHTARFREENAAPYALAGDAKGNYHKWRTKPGKYQIGVTPYLDGVKGETFRAALEVLGATQRSFLHQPAAKSRPRLDEDEGNKLTENEAKDLQGESAETAKAALKRQELGTKDSSLVAQELSLSDANTEPTAISPATVNQAMTPEMDDLSSIPNDADGSDAFDTDIPLGETFSFALSDTQVNPPTRSRAFGHCSALIDEENNEAIFGCTHSVMDPTSAYASFKRQGESEEVTWCGFDSAQTPIAAECPLSSEVREALRDGRLFVTIATKTHPHGEIRGLVVNQG